MKPIYLRTLTLLLLFAVLLLLVAPAVAETQNTVVTLTACEVTVVKDSSAQDIVFTMDGESDKTSAFVAKGGAVTISVSAIPSGKNLIVSHTGNAVLTKSGLTITVSNIQSERVTVTMKLESAGSGGGSSGGDGGDVIPPPPKVYTAFVDENGDANFPTHKVIYRVTVPEEHEGKRIDIIDRTSVKARADMDVYHQADIKHHFDLAEGGKTVVHFKIPVSDLEAEGLGADDACLYYYSGDTGWRMLDTWYTVVGDTVFYESEANADGSFAVVFEEGAAKPKDTGGDEPVTPPEDEPCEPCYPCIVVLLLVLLAGIATAVILRRRKNVEKQ